MRISYDMRAVHDAVKRIAREQLRRAVGGGQDSPSIRLTFAPGSLPLSIPAEPKFQIKWEIDETPDGGDIVGRVLWTLLGYSGTYPVVTDYVGDVPPTAHPTYFSDQDHAAQVAEDCATRLRDQFSKMFEA
jgi:hypothetical protein